MCFEIDFSPDAISQLKALRKRDQVVVLDAIERQLRDTPFATTRNRKPMRSNILATWELRVGVFRVYYDINVVKESVAITAIGMKIQNRLFIAGEEITLP